MTIDGTNISTYGLEVIGLPEYYSLPARKSVLTVPGFEAKDLVYEGKEATVTLFGEYASLSAMNTAIEAFYTKIRSALKHDYILIGHGLTFSGVIVGGIKPEIIGKTVQMKITIKITA